MTRYVDALIRLYRFLEDTPVHPNPIHHDGRPRSDVVPLAPDTAPGTLVYTHLLPSTQRIEGTLIHNGAVVTILTATGLVDICAHPTPGPVAPFASGTEEIRLCPDCAAYVDRLGAPVKCECVGET